MSLLQPVELTSKLEVLMDDNTDDEEQEDERDESNEDDGKDGNEDEEEEEKEEEESFLHHSFADTCKQVAW